MENPATAGLLLIEGRVVSYGARREEGQGLGRGTLPDVEKLDETRGILFLEDESGLSLIPLMSRTWAPMWCTPTIRNNSHWEKLSATAVIALDGGIHLRVHEGSIRSGQIIKYLEQLLRHIPSRHIVLLWDESRTGVSNATKAFFEAHADRITAFRLPPYSPRFNPVELLWAEIKWSRMREFCPKNSGELRRRLCSCVRSLRRKTAVVRSYFEASDLPVGANHESKLCGYQQMPHTLASNNVLVFLT